MKKLLIIFIFTITYFPFCQAQSGKQKSVNIKLSPQHLLFFPQQWGASAEVFLNGKHSIGGNLYYVNNHNNLVFEENKHQGIGGGIIYRYYPFEFITKKSAVQKGFYVSPFLQSEYLKIKFTSIKYQTPIINNNGNTTGYNVNPQEQTIFSLQTGLTMGYQWTWWNFFVFDIYAGLGYRYANSTLTSNDKFYYPVSENHTLYRFIDKSYSGILPKLGFQIGFAF